MGVALNPATSAAWHWAQGSAPQADGTAIRASATKGKQAFRNDSNPGDMDAQVILMRRADGGQQSRRMGVDATEVTGIPSGVWSEALECVQLAAAFACASLLAHLPVRQQAGGWFVPPASRP